MFQVVIENSTGLARRCGYCDFTNQVDLELFTIETYTDRPQGLTVVPLPSLEAQKETLREAMRSLYLSAPLTLQKMFAPLMSQVFDALDMNAYDLAVVLVEDADLSLVTEPEQHTLAEGIQAQILTHLQTLKTLLGG